MSSINNSHVLCMKIIFLINIDIVTISFAFNDISNSNAENRRLLLQVLVIFLPMHQEFSSKITCHSLGKSAMAMARWIEFLPGSSG
jgi:hypothetical protein